MSIFTNKKFRDLLKTYGQLDKSNEPTIPHNKLAINELFIQLRESIKNGDNDTGAYKTIVPYPLDISNIEEVSVMDLTGGFNSNPKSWEIIQPGTGCVGMLAVIVDDDELVFKENRRQVEEDDSYEEEMPELTRLFWITEDYEYLVSTSPGSEPDDYLIGHPGISEAFASNHSNLGLTFEEVVELVRHTMLYQVSMSCRIVHEDDNVYKQYNS